jgi:hypothetical protein
MNSRRRRRKRVKERGVEVELKAQRNYLKWEELTFLWMLL